MKLFTGMIVGALLIGSAAAQQVAPDVLMRNVTNDVLTIVSKDQDIQNGNTAKAIALVEAKVLSDFDFTRMTALALGKEWRKATPDQQSVLTSEFRTLLVRTYSRALTSYKNQPIDFKPTKMTGDETEVTVRTEIKQPGTPAVSIDYAMEKSESTWKVYDITVGGISLVMSFRDQFGQEVLNGGIDGLIRTLHAKNDLKAKA
jgi:phospholipid transport system substrate-binding protein